MSKVIRKITEILIGKEPQAPTLEKEVPEAPNPDDGGDRRAQERKYQRRYAGAGRTGTVLSDSGTLG